MTIQEQINALGSAGGKVSLPPGDFTSEGPIVLPSSVVLEGSGIATIVGAIRWANNGRQYFNTVRDLQVKATPENNYIGIDFRNVSASSINNVFITGFKTGLLLAYACYYNLIENVLTDCSVDGIELYSGANQNTIVNCKPSAPVPIYIMDSNGTTIIGGSGEGAANQGSFIKQTGESVGTAVRGFRGEASNYGPVWCNTDNLVGNF